MMNNVDKIFSNHKNPADFSKNYTHYLTDIFSKLDFNAIGKFAEILLEARKNSKQIFFIGNGGSAATASHFANDIAIGTRCTPPFKAISLTDNVASMTAIGNDFGYEELFSKQLEKYLNDGDVVVAISASGNSPNIIKALEYAKTKNAYTVGLSGFDGGKLKQMADLCLHVPSEKGEYGPVEDLHMIFDHIIGSYLMRAVR